MIQSLKKRLEVIEQTTIKTEIPVLVMIYKDDSTQKWVAKEQYIKMSSKGKIIPQTGYEKIIPLEKPEDYKRPQGFKGVILNEGRIFD